MFHQKSQAIRLGIFYFARESGVRTARHRSVVRRTAQRAVGSCAGINWIPALAGGFCGAPFVCHKPRRLGDVRKQNRPMVS